MPKQTFDSALKKLDKIVRELEAGELPLEKAIQKFEEGMSLSKYCTTILDDTEKKVTILIKDAEGSQVETTFDRNNHL